MKIVKGHYVPKELITSEAVHEAVVKCFVSAGFDDCRPMYGKFENKDCFHGLCADNKGCISWGAKGSLARTPLTLQQLFTAENGLEWPDWADKVCTDGSCVWFSGIDIKVISGKFNNKSAITTLATRQPEGKEVKEKSPLGEYEWGKEYPTNGKRPDLADDVLIQAKGECFFGWTNKANIVVNFFWHNVTAFRITDPRYKPVDEDGLDIIEKHLSKPDDSLSGRAVMANEMQNQATEAGRHYETIKRPEPYVSMKIAKVDQVSEISENKSEDEVIAMIGDIAITKDAIHYSPTNTVHEFAFERINNNWHERGELPPVGFECLCQAKKDVGRSSFCKVKIVGYGKTTVAMESLQNIINAKAGDLFVESFDDLEFRPIRTEREKVIDAALKVSAHTSKQDPRDMMVAVIHKLYEAGMLVLPPKKSDTED